MIGYKIAKNGERRVVVTLEIPNDALTNMNRSSIAVKETAKYRANKAKVLKIEDDEGNCYSTATSFNYDKSLEHKLGEVIEEPSYDKDPEEVYAEGIHYYLNKRVAELYGLMNIFNGLFENWHENGQKAEEIGYVDGKKHGLCQRWYMNGQKQMEIVYVNGKRHGLSQLWYENGQKWVECSFVYGAIHGLYREWGEDGVKIKEATYVNGVRQ